MHAAARIGDQQRPRAEPFEHPHGQSDLLRRVALIDVKPSPHRHHPPSRQGPDEQLPGMALDGGEGEPRDLAVRDPRLHRHLVREPREPGAQEERGVGNDFRPRRPGRRRLVDHPPRWPSSARSSASWRSSSARNPATYAWNWRSTSALCRCTSPWSARASSTTRRASASASRTMTWASRWAVVRVSSRSCCAATSASFIARSRSRYTASCSPSAASRSSDRKSTRLNSSHDQISYAVFCLKKKKLNHCSSTNFFYLALDH